MKVTDAINLLLGEGHTIYDIQVGLKEHYLEMNELKTKDEFA